MKVLYQFILFIICFIIFLAILQESNDVTLSTNFADPSKVCILLTTSTKVKGCTEQETNTRIDMYNATIKDYLEKSSLTVYVVNSSGYTFPDFANNPRVKIFAFTQYPLPGSSTYGEALSILRAVDYFDFSKYEYFIKITGRYFIQDLEQVISRIPKKTEILLQYSHKKLVIPIYQNTEIFGCQTKYLKQIFEFIFKYSPIQTFESTATYLSYIYKYYRFPKLYLIKPVQRGGDKMVMHYL